MRKGAQAPKRRQGAAFFPGACTRHVRGLYETCKRPVRGLYEKHFYFKMLITFEPNVAQRSVASQNDHKSKACLPEASNTASTMYRCLKRRLRRLYEAPFLATFFLAPHSSKTNPTKSTTVSSYLYLAPLASSFLQTSVSPRSFASLSGE